MKLDLARGIVANSQAEYGAIDGYYALLLIAQKEAKANNITAGQYLQFETDIKSIIAEEEKHINILKNWDFIFIGIKAEED